MQEWFVKESLSAGLGSSGQSPKLPSAFALPPHKDTDVAVAEIKFASQTDPLAGGTVLSFADPSAHDELTRLIDHAIGPCSIGGRGCVLLAQPLNQLEPLHLTLQADTIPSIKELSAFLPSNPLTNPVPGPPVNYFQIVPVGSNTFRLALKAPVYGAAEYLAWTEPLTADFDLIRKALQRPYARIDTDYSQPFLIGIPNFITIRTVVQILSQRAQCYLLLGQPAEAWHELALIHDLTQILLDKPAMKPITLVGAMINVAVCGLYAETVEDGLRLHAWREPQLAAIQRQLGDIDLLPSLVESFREEWSAVYQTFETMPRAEMVKLFFSGYAGTIVRWMPQGWFYQNLVAGAEARHDMLGSLDLTNRLVVPHQVSEVVRQSSEKFSPHSPYTFFVVFAQPNYAKAVQTLAFNQTRVNEAKLACALERYRMAQGRLPDTLEVLAPQFVESIPHDLIGGQPLKYGRANNGSYVIYSVGWNEKDDGGIAGKSKEEGDWAWQVH
jgi:hypothetical protein